MNKKRPKNVPAEAIFTKKNEWQLCELDKKGFRQGRCQLWKEDGTYFVDTICKDDKLNGLKKVYLHDGSLECEEQFTDGKYVEGSYYVNKKLNACIYKGASDAIVKWKLVATTPDYVNLTLFYNKKNEQVDINGNPIPKRPAEVPKEANYYALGDPHWVTCFFKFPGFLKYGHWKRWSFDGDLQCEEFYSDSGNMVTLKAHSYGELRKVTHFDPEINKPTRIVEYIWNKLSFQTDYFYEKSELRSRRDYTFKNGKKLKWGEGKWSSKSKLIEYSLYAQSNKKIQDIVASGPIEDEALVGVWKVKDAKLKNWLSVKIGDEYLTITDNYTVGRLRYFYLQNNLNLAMKKPMKIPQQLNQFSKISWAEVATTYGKKAKLFPKYIAIIASGEEIELVARAKIFNECFHQETLYESTGRIIPIYIELLKSKKTNREGVLEDLKQFGLFTIKEAAEILKDKSIKVDSSLWYSSVGVIKAFSEGAGVFKEIIAENNPKLTPLAKPLLKFAKFKF